MLLFSLDCVITHVTLIRSASGVFMEMGHFFHCFVFQSFISVDLS